jgi:hypothetical protein
LIAAIPASDRKTATISENETARLVAGRVMVVGMTRRRNHRPVVVVVVVVVTKASAALLMGAE